MNENSEDQNNNENPPYDPIALLDQSLAHYESVLGPSMAAMLKGLSAHGIPIPVAASMVSMYFAQVMSIPPPTAE